MKKKEVFRRSVSIVLVWMLIIGSFINVSAVQSDVMIEGEWLYEIVNDSVVITGYIGETSDLTIPSTIGGKAVKEIGFQVFQNHDELINVTILNGIKKNRR